MLALILDAARQAIASRHGDDCWQEVLEETGLRPHLQGENAQLSFDQAAAGTSSGTRSAGTHDLGADADHFGAVIACAAQRLGQSPPELLRQLGRSTFPIMHDRLERASPGCLDSREFIQAIPHLLTQSLDAPGQQPAVAHARDDGNDLELEYTWHHNLCHLAEGLALAALDHFGQRVPIEQTECSLTGGNRCIIRIRFGPSED